MKYNGIKFEARWLVLCVAVCAAVGCQDKAEDDDADVPFVPERVEMRAALAPSGDVQTKTALDGTLVRWLSTDRVGLYSESYATSGGSQFTVSSISTSNVATLVGDKIPGTSYVAYYPYSSSAVYSVADKNLNLTLPTGQTYASGSFADGANPMVATGGDLQNMLFYNLCGVVCLQISGVGQVKTISVEGNDGELLSGSCTLSLGYTEGAAPPSLDCLDMSGGVDYVKLVNINQYLLSTPQKFYIVVPAHTYAEGLTFSITDDAGVTTVKKSSSAISVPRAEVVTFAPMTINAIQSGRGVIYYGANNSIIPQSPGTAETVDVTPHYTYRSSNYAAQPQSVVDGSYDAVDAAVVWQEKPDLVSGVSLLAGNKLQFTASATSSGNALVALYDGVATDPSSHIVWSFHIWVGSGRTAATDQLYYNRAQGQVGYMMDRNLGATSSAAASAGAYGLLYQWGRKDPFSFTVSFAKVATSATYTYVWQTAAVPTTFLSGVGESGYSWLYGDKTNPDDGLWGAPSGSQVGAKSVFDPCPEGYYVPPIGVWDIFTQNGTGTSDGSQFNVDGDYADGWNFYYQGFRMPSGVTSFYSTHGYIYGETGDLIDGGGGYWSRAVSTTSSYVPANLYMSKFNIDPNSIYAFRSHGFFVRCCREM